MELTTRQERIVEIVKQDGPITGKEIAKKLSLIRATLRPDLTLLIMAGILEARPRVGYYYTGKTPLNLVAKVIQKIKVGDVKSVPIVIRDNASVYDAVVMMFLEDVGTLFVVKEGGFLEGVISRKDLLKTAMGGADINKMPIGVVMTRMPNLITTTPEESVFIAAQKLNSREVDALPVVRAVRTENGVEELEVVGRITKTTITRLFVELGGPARNTTQSINHRPQHIYDRDTVALCLFHQCLFQFRKHNCIGNDPGYFFSLLDDFRYVGLIVNIGRPSNVNKTRVKLTHCRPCHKIRSFSNRI